MRKGCYYVPRNHTDYWFNNGMFVFRRSVNNERRAKQIVLNKIKIEKGVKIMKLLQSVKPIKVTEDTLFNQLLELYDDKDNELYNKKEIHTNARISTILHDAECLKCDVKEIYLIKYDGTKVLLWRDSKLVKKYVWL